MATPLSVASGHAARDDSNQAVSFECLYAQPHFFPLISLSGLWPPSSLLIDYDGAVCET